VTYSVKVQIPGAPEGAEVIIPGLGTFQNGVVGQVDDEQVHLFVKYQNDATPSPVEEGEEESFQRGLSEILDNAQYLSMSKSDGAKAPKAPKEGDK